MLSSTILYMNVFSQKLEGLLNLFIEVRYGKTSKEKIDGIIKSRKNKILSTKEFQTLKFKDVSFSYNTKDGENISILKNISLQINKGGLSMENKFGLAYAANGVAATENDWHTQKQPDFAYEYDDFKGSCNLKVISSKH